MTSVVGSQASNQYLKPGSSRKTNHEALFRATKGRKRCLSLNSQYTQYFYYDTAGNRTKSNLGGANTIYYYDYIDRMTKYGTTELGWDTWGNMTKVGSHAYYYDDADRLTKYDYATGTTNDSTFHYLPASWKRYKRVQDTTAEYFVYDGPNVVDSYTSGGTLNARYVTPGLDENLSMTRSGSAYYYMADGLGSIRNVLESDEDTANIYDYYAFGNTLGTPTTGVTSPYEYTAREFENGGVNTTLYYRNRYYMSALGIFTSRDAMWADVHRGWGYVRNNPVHFADPFGRDRDGDDSSWDNGGWTSVYDAAMLALAREFAGMPAPFVAAGGGVGGTLVAGPFAGPGAGLASRMYNKLVNKLGSWLGIVDPCEKLSDTPEFRLGYWTGPGVVGLYGLLSGIMAEAAAASNPVAGLPQNLKNYPPTDIYHNFPSTIDQFGGDAYIGKINGNYVEWHLPGSVNGNAGVYQWGVEDGVLTHRFFEPMP